MKNECIHKKVRPLSSSEERNREVLMLGCQTNLRVDNQTGVPIIEEYEVRDLPEKMIAFNDAVSVSQKDRDAMVHFYIDDYRFIKLFRNPDKYIPILKEYRYVIGPDLSQYIEMLGCSRYANCCMNKAMTAYMQQQGVNIVVNATWSLPDSYDYSFSGIPQGSVIAINSNGVNAHSDSKYLWYKGYEEALKRIQPSRIIRYGQKMDYEDESISTYYENTYLRRMRHGC